MNTTIAALLIGAAVLAAFSLWIFTYLRSQRSSRPRFAVPPVYTNHARERMLERQVQQHHIEEVLAKPSRQIPGRDNESVRLEAQIDGRILKVWVVAEHWITANKATVKTTAWADLVQTFQIPAGQTGIVIGPGGSSIRQIEAATNARISIGRTGMVTVSAGCAASVEKAKQMIFRVIDRAHGAGPSGYRAA
ncbi:KH domain-containing protein [Pseudarthrobacter sp. 1C304]|uniref:KH domain-containing protein n=1 Tax=Pseudarthrobacter sp. 1C304 TaxID=3457438 RepID=UPI003FD03075